MEREAKLAKRSMILEFEDMLCQCPDAIYGNALPLRHVFTPGIYTREIFLPAGYVLTGRIHRHEHPNFLMAGVVDVFTEDGGLERLEAPMWTVSPAGTKRVVSVIEDAIWVTIHANPDNTESIEELESRITIESYGEIEDKI
jgi:hypothetical protein